ncbi:MAG TPA: rod shape-determining protein MreC [Methylomirabilota bacterium]
MPLLEERRRGSVLLLAVVVVGHIILISAQVTSRSGTPVLQAVAFGIVSEVQRVGAGIVQGVSSLWGGYVDLRGLREENEQLRRDLGEARLLLQQERALAARSAQLQDLLDLKTTAGLETVAAEVVAAGATPDFRTVTIDRGTAAGLRPDMAVLAPGGVVGRLIVPGARASKIQLLIDRNAAAGAIVERTRAQGVAVGVGEGHLRLDFVAATADVQVGDTVATSGIDGIYPKGFLIGRVDHVERGGSGYRLIRVQPAVDFSSLEEVLVVLTPPIAEPEADAPPAGTTP